jgi:type IV pilus assembly protein PilM
MNFSGLFSKHSVVGVDIGTSNIKIAQISHNKDLVLDTYGIVNLSYQIGTKDDPEAVKQTANILKTLLSKAHITAKRCAISFPNSAVFTSVIELPRMSDNDLATAVEFEAKKYVPLSISDVDLSWVILNESSNISGMLKVLLTAVPKQVTKNYMKVFELAGLDPQVGEIEALALIRSLVGNKRLNCVIIDIGAKNTGLNIIEKGFLRLSRNLNVGGETITNKISESLRISKARSEQFKRDFGVTNSTFIPDTIKPVLSIIKNETKQLLTIAGSQGLSMEKIILVGGGANLPGLVDFFNDLKVSVELGDPLKAVGYSKDLEAVLKRYSLSLPIAIGLALRDKN